MRVLPFIPTLACYLCSGPRGDARDRPVRSAQAATFANSRPAPRRSHVGVGVRAGGAGAPPGHADRSDYLALGDSVTFGYREAANLPTPDYSDAASFVGYPEDVGAALGLDVANAACPGETSTSLVEPNVLEQRM